MGSELCILDSFKSFVHSEEYEGNFKKAPLICLSVSSIDTYRRTGNHHPVLC
ncbi:putative oxygenase MesX, partial [Enterobacter hormaechei]